MDKNLIVQLIVDTGGDEVGCGTAYPVAPNRLITAAHVVDNASPEQVEASWYHQKEGDRGWVPCVNIVWDGRPNFDVMILQIEFPESVRDRFGNLINKEPQDDVRWNSEAFPLVGQRDDKWEALPMKGATYSMGDQSDHFHLNVDDPPEPGWDGASGSPVFVDGGIMGVIVVCPDDFKNGRLEAVPLCRLLADEDFKAAIGRTEDENRKKLVDAAVHELASSHDALVALAGRLEIPDPGDPTKWARAVVDHLLDGSAPPEILIPIITAQRDLDRQNEKEAADALERFAYCIVPAALTDAHVQQMTLVADSNSERREFQAKTRTFVELTLARISGRRAWFLPVSGQTDTPSGKLCLPAPPEAGMDEDHGGFVTEFIGYLAKTMVGKGLHSVDDDETVSAINEELESRFELEQWQYYYVFENPKNDAERRRRHELATRLDQLFPRIAFIALDRAEGSPEERGTVSRMMRILCRAAGIEWEPYGPDQAAEGPR